MSSTTASSGAGTASPPPPDIHLDRLPGVVDPLTLAEAAAGRHPLVLSVRGWLVALADPVEAVTSLDDLLRRADEVRWRDGHDPRLPPFLGGLAGYLSDDLAPALLDLPAAPGEGGRFHPDPRPQVAPLPPLWFGAYDTAVCIPPSRDATWLVAAELRGSAEPARRRLESLRRRLQAARPAPPAPATSAARILGTTLDRARHAAAVEQILAWIAAGDLYQLNLTLQVAASWPGTGVALARRLWAASPNAAHAAYLSLPGNVEVVSVSPETFLRSGGDEVSIRPIKGTAARCVDPAADAAAAARLRTSAKDHAEHVMIVDLERNDLGRVCRTGTVEVPALAALEAHPNVWHLVSTVRGRLRADVDLRRLLAATFPCGSVTGAPKRMAVARTSLLEPVRRGVYCGAVGVVTRGLVDLSVAIRTAVLHDGTATYGTGGGIVADSNADSEWEEAMAKARPFLSALECARGG